ncbi:MAG: hypothetical protein OSA43_09930 [Pirellulales bacterium]|nr:hypothetical protein [Pirellulales bacterium]
MSIEVLLYFAFEVDDLFEKCDELDSNESKLQERIFCVYEFSDAIGSSHYPTTLTDLYHSDSHCATSTFSGFTGRNVSDTINAVTVMNRPFLVSCVTP